MQRENFKIVVPQAPLYYMDISKSEQYSWFRLDKNGNPIESDINKSAMRVMNLAKNELSPTNDYSKVYIGGFSLGACLALYLCTAYNIQFGKVACLSGMLVLPNLIEDVPTVTKIRIWHGKSDDVINCEIAKKSYETILKLSNVKMSVVDGVGHEAPSVITSQLYKFLLE